MSSKWGPGHEQHNAAADENFRETCQKLRAEADKYPDLIEQSLQGKQQVEHLFTIRWRITA